MPRAQRGPPQFFSGETLVCRCQFLFRFGAVSGCRGIFFCPVWATRGAFLKPSLFLRWPLPSQAAGRKEGPTREERSCTCAAQLYWHVLRGGGCTVYSTAIAHTANTHTYAGTQTHHTDMYTDMYTYTQAHANRIAAGRQTLKSTRAQN